MCVLLCCLFCSPVHLQKNVVEKKCRKSWSESIEVWLQKPRISLKHPGGRLVSSFRPLRSLATFLSVPGLSDSIHLDVFGGFFLSENPHFPNKLTGRFLVGEVLTTWNYSEKMASQKERIIFEPPKLLWKEYVYPADFSFLWFDGGNLSKTWAVSLEMLFVFLEQWDVKPQFSGVWFLPSDLVFDVSFRWKTFAIWHWIWFCLHSKLSRCKRKFTATWKQSGDALLLLKVEVTQLRVQQIFGDTTCTGNVWRAGEMVQAVLILVFKKGTHPILP